MAVGAEKFSDGDRRPALHVHQQDVRMNWSGTLPTEATERLWGGLSSEVDVLADIMVMMTILHKIFDQQNQSNLRFSVSDLSSQI